MLQLDLAKVVDQIDALGAGDDANADPRSPLPSHQDPRRAARGKGSFQRRR